MFVHLHKAHFKVIYQYNKAVFKSNYGWLISTLLIQYWHNVATNIAYYVHRRTAPLLWDIGFKIFPESDSIDAINEAVMVIAIVISVILALLPSFMKPQYTNGITTMLIVIRFCKVFGFTVILRTACFLTTSLPSPSHHCRIDSTTYNPPTDISEIFLRMDATDGCGDLIFSGHTATTLCVVLTISHYSSFFLPKLWKYIAFGLLLPIVLCLAVLIIISQNHYTVDVVIALYTVPLLYFFAWHTFPDDIPKYDENKGTDDDVEMEIIHDSNDSDRPDADIERKMTTLKTFFLLPKMALRLPSNNMENNYDGNFLTVDPLKLSFDDESASTDYLSSPMASPLSTKYRSRLKQPQAHSTRYPAMMKKKSSTPQSFILYTTDSETEDDETDIDESMCSNFAIPSSCRSMPDTINRSKLYSPIKANNASRSDRFIPSRFAFTKSYDSFNISDTFNHSPPSIIKNHKNKKRKSVQYKSPKTVLDSTSNLEYKSDESSHSPSNQKYDECLQNLLLPQSQSSNSSHIIPKNSQQSANYFEKYEHHLSECPLFACPNSESTKDCICKYILKERINYNHSPKKVFKFSYHSNAKNKENENNVNVLPDNVTSIISKNSSHHDLENKNSNQSETKKFGANIPCEPIKSFDLSSIHKHKELANDYYYHLMDFKMNQNFGCIALKDALHLIRGHFEDLDDAQTNKYIMRLNKKQNICPRDYHFCCLKLSKSNDHILCMGDNFGRLLFYNYLRESFASTMYKSNECRISVLDWQQNHNNHNQAHGALIAAGSLDKAIRIYDDRCLAQVTKLKYHRGEVCGLKWNPFNEHLLLSGGNQNIVCCWDIRKNRIPLFVGQHKAAIRALAWHPECESMFISGGGSNDQCIKIWNLKCAKKERLSLLTGSQVCNLECLEFNKRHYLVSSHGFSSNSIIVWNMDYCLNEDDDESGVQLTRIKQLSGHKCRVLYLCKYSDSNIVSASAGPDQTMKYWKIFPSQMESPFVNHVPNVIR